MKFKFTMPIKGPYVRVEEASDEAFANKQLGDGFLLNPEEGKVYAPFTGEVNVLFPGGHAIGLKDMKGVEMLIHIGLDTVKLKGEGFTPHVEQGANIRKGDLLLEFDMDTIHKNGYATDTPVIFPGKTSVETVKIKERPERDVLKVKLD